MEQTSLYPSGDGTPQGGIISPTLANLTLDGLQALLRQRFPVSVSPEGEPGPVSLTTSSSPAPPARSWRAGPAPRGAVPR